jgi:hypothetical protein
MASVHSIGLASQRRPNEQATGARPISTACIRTGGIRAGSIMNRRRICTALVQKYEVSVVHATYLHPSPSHHSLSVSSLHHY